MYEGRERFLAVLGASRSSSTKTVYDRVMTGFFAMYSEVNEATVIDYLVGLRSGGQKKSAVTVACYANAIKKYCKVMGIELNTTNLPIPRKAIRENSYVTDAIYRDGIHKIASSSCGLLSVFVVLYNTGLRASELLALNKSAVDLDAQTIRVIGKGDKERVIPIPESIVHVFDDTFFELIGSLTYAQLYAYSKKWFGYDITPHSFRHGYTTRLINGGVDANSVQRVLGHSSIVTTMRYMHRTSNEAHNAVLKVLK